MALYNRVAEVTVIDQKRGAANIIGGRTVCDQGRLRHPIRVDFDVVHDLDSSPNEATIRIFNLSPESQAAISIEGSAVILKAGYWPHNGADTSEQIFVGQIRSAETIPHDVDTITTLQCGDGDDGFAFARTNFIAGSREEAAREAATTFERYGIKVGTLEFGENIPEPGQRRSHRTTKAELDDIARTTDSQWSIQDGVFNMWSRSKPLTRGRTLINAQTGLIGAPEWNDNGATFRTLMLPFIRPGEVIALGTERNIRGDYRVEWVNFTGSPDRFGATIDTRHYGRAVERSRQQFVGDET